MSTRVAQSSSSKAGTGDVARIVHAPYPVQRPYTPLFMSLREQCNTLIDGMDLSRPSALQPLATKEGETHDPGLIIATIDWDGARLVLAWANGEDDPVRAEGSLDWTLDLSGLKRVALATDRPRACFDSHALHILSVAQDYLVEYLRDGPTDDIPYERHLIVAQGMAGDETRVWIRNVLFMWDERRG